MGYMYSNETICWQGFAAPTSFSLSLYSIIDSRDIIHTNCDSTQLKGKMNVFWLQSPRKHLKLPHYKL
jgi:hypothetical protein